MENTYILWLNFIVGLNFIFFSLFLSMIMNSNDFKRRESMNIIDRLNHNVIIHVRCYYQGLKGYKIKWMQSLTTP